MTKSAVLALALFTLASLPAYAYVDNRAGYSIDDRKPQIIIRSSNLYAFIDEDKNNIAVHTFFAAEVEALTGVKFSTAVFLEEYEKLALLQRSQLSLKTLPIPLLDLAKYQNDGQRLFLSANVGEREADIRIDKFNKLKVITLSYPADKESPTAYASFVSDNDLLYIITFSDNGMDSDKLKSKQAEDVNKDAWQQFLRSAKTFKTRKPKTIQTAMELQYYDSISKNTVKLPSDWVYVQANFKDKYNQGCLTASVPLDSMCGLVKIIQSDLEINSPAEIKTGTDAILDDDSVFLAVDGILQRRRQVGQKIASELDEVLFTASLKIKDHEWKDLFINPESTQFVLTPMLEHSLQRLKYFNNDNFALNDYVYSADINDSDLSIKINSNISLYKDNDFDTLTQIYCTPKNQINLLLYMQKDTVNQQLDMMEVQKNWQF